MPLSSNPGLSKDQADALYAPFSYSGDPTEINWGGLVTLKGLLSIEMGENSIFFGAPNSASLVWSDSTIIGGKYLGFTKTQYIGEDPETIGTGFAFVPQNADQYRKGKVLFGMNLIPDADATHDIGTITEPYWNSSPTSGDPDGTMALKFRDLYLSGDVKDGSGNVKYQAAGSYLTEETDPVFTAWDKSTGISITESQISDLQAYYKANDDISVGTIAGGVATLSGGNGNAAFTLLNLNNNATPVSGNTAQTSDLVFNLTQSVNSVVSLHEAAKISAYKVSDWFHATAETDTDSGLKFYTTNNGTSTLQMTIPNTGGITMGSYNVGSTQWQYVSSMNQNVASNYGVSFATVATGVVRNAVISQEVLNGTEQFIYTVDDQGFGGMFFQMLANGTMSWGAGGLVDDPQPLDVRMYRIAAGTLGFSSADVADTDISFQFVGTTHTGVFTWMEDEDYFQFNDDINLASGEVLKVNATQVVGARVIDARIDDTINSGDATTDGVIDALRDAMIAHGLMAAS